MPVTGATAKFKLPYFKPGDSPPDMAAVTQAISERIEALLAKGGDVSIAADGTITISQKDGEPATPSMRTLGTGAKQAAAGNDSRLSDERVPKKESATEEKIGDGAATSRKTKLTTAQATCSGSLTLGASLADVPGCSVTLTLATKSIVVVVASWQFELTKLGEGAAGSLFYNGADQAAAGQAFFKGTATGQRELRTLPFLIPQEAGERTIKMRAQSFSEAEGKVLTGSGGATRMVCFVLAA